MDAIDQFKQGQRQAWSLFTPFEIITGTAAPALVRFARIRPGARVLDVGCGTGVVALTAARGGARAAGVDLTPELIEKARSHSSLTGLDIDWHVGDAEALPFEDATFDVVLSQFGHMFAPRPDLATREMLRVLAPGGTLAFSTWPPELFTGRLFGLTGKYLPPPPPGVSPPAQWGDVALVRERLGSAVRDIAFDRATMRAPALSPQHSRMSFEVNVGPVIKLVASLKDDPGKLAQFRAELDALCTEYFDDSQNLLRQDFLITRAVKS